MKYLVVILFLFLAGCGHNIAVPTPELYERPVYQPIKITPVTQKPVEWIVVTKKNIDQVIKDAVNSEGSVVLFALTPQGYENLANNDTNLRTFILQQTEVVAGYKEYYEKPLIPPNPDRKAERPFWKFW